MPLSLKTKSTYFRKCFVLERITGDKSMRSRYASLANSTKMQSIFGTEKALAAIVTLFGGASSLSVIGSKQKALTFVSASFWSGLRGSNPPPPPWQGGALPNELNPHIWCLRSESNQRHEDFQSSALPTELQRHTRWRLGWGSNPRPLA